ncbi:MAG: superoxide dismutase family protein [Gammaproteobacteria bacterium]|nr:superoxide dismutase [Gammaproteobacteria bacterium]
MYRLLATCTALLLVACGRSEGPDGSADTTQDTQMPESASESATTQPTSAVVQIEPTQGNTVSGMLTIVAEDDGVRLTGTLQGLKPDGEFGFHIHEKGDCSAPDASSAGGHFNPLNVAHGHPESDTHHVGDMMNLKSDADGVAQVDARAFGATLNTGEPTDVLGRAVVVHESADDYTSQPAGNSGARIGCGVITLKADGAAG